MSKVLILRNVPANMISCHGFVWPESGMVEAPDWQPHYKCGNGLHGLLWGCGSTAYFLTDRGTKWLVVEADESDVLTGKGELTDKCKFRRGNIVYCGNRTGAIKHLDAHGAHDKPVVYARRTAGECGQATAGDYGRATVGEGGQATVRDYGQAIAGIFGQAIAFHAGRATAGDYGQAIAGQYGQATAGDAGHATVETGGQAAAGNGGIISV